MTSANVVGYQNVVTKSGFTLLAPTFEKVDGSALTLGDIIPIGEEVGYGTEFITVFNETLDIAAEYTYYGTDIMEVAGWYDGDDQLCNNVELGEKGVGVQFESDSATVQFSGAVTSGKAQIENLVAGFNSICNILPVNLDIQDFVVKGDNAGYGSEFITTYDETNAIAGEYTYYGTDIMEVAGWYDGDDQLVTVEIPAGYGFILDCGGDVTIELPAVL